MPQISPSHPGGMEQFAETNPVNQPTGDRELQPLQQSPLQLSNPSTSLIACPQAQEKSILPSPDPRSPHCAPQPTALVPTQPTPVPNQRHALISDLDLSARSRTAADLASTAPPEQVANSSSMSRSAFAPALTSQSATDPPQPLVNPDWVAEQTEDPDLGILKLQEPPNSNPANPLPDQVTPGQLLPNCESPDPELGCLRLNDAPVIPPPAPRAPVLYLLARLDFFKSSNIYSGVDPIDDGLFRPGISLYTIPPLGPNTYFVGSIDGNLVRYSTQKSINYDELRLRAGIIQRLSPTMFGEIGWGNQQLFIRSNDIAGLGSGERFLNDHAIRLELNRQDQLGKRWRLNTFYQFRLSFADPVDRSRLSNALFVSLNYDILPNLQAGLDYQFVLVNFTQQKRDDQFHQLIARLSYTLFRNTQLNLFAGYSFGSSTDSMVNFDGSVLGVSLSTSLALF